MRARQLLPVGAVLGADADDTLEIVASEERTERQLAERRLALGMVRKPADVRHGPLRFVL